MAAKKEVESHLQEEDILEDGYEFETNGSSLEFAEQQHVEKFNGIETRVPIEKKTNCETQLNDRETQITVDCPIKSVNMMETFVTYRLQVSSSNPYWSDSLKNVIHQKIEIRRRFNDFIYLRNLLELHHPTRMIPPLPDKHPLHTLDRFSGSFIHRRSSALQRFLLRLVDHPVLSANSAVCHFLTDSLNGWEEYKRTNPLPSTLLKGFSGAFSSIKSLKSGGSGADALVTDALGLDYVVLENNLSSMRDVFDSLESTAHQISTAEKAHQVCKAELLTAMFDMLQFERSNFSFEENACDEAPALSAEPLVAAVYSACDASVHAGEPLAEDLEEHLAQPLHDQLLYTDVVRAMVRRVRDLNDVYTKNEQAAAAAASGQQHRDQLDQKAEFNRGESLLDELTIAKADLMSDMARWSESKHEDAKLLFSRLADFNVNAFRNSLAAWETAAMAIATLRTTMGSDVAL